MRLITVMIQSSVTALTTCTNDEIWLQPLQCHQVELQTFVSLGPSVLHMLLLHLLPYCHPPMQPH